MKGHVRSVQEARDCQAEQKAKRDWASAIDEQIRRTLVETGYFHADDLDVLGMPPEHCNLKGTRAAWFRNQGFMEETGERRKVSHLAANGRKTPVHRITKLGREKLVGVGGGPLSARNSGATPDPGEVTPAAATDRVACQAAGEPVPLFEAPTQRPLNAFTDAEAA